MPALLTPIFLLFFDYLQLKVGIHAENKATQFFFFIYII